MNIPSNPKNLNTVEFYKAAEVANKVTGWMENIRDRYSKTEDHGISQYHDKGSGCSDGFFGAAWEEDWTVKFDPKTRVCQSMDYTSVRNENNVERRVAMKFRLEPDGSKLFSCRNYWDNQNRYIAGPEEGGRIADKTETARLAADGTFTYSKEETSHKFKSWLRTHHITLG